MDWFPVVFIAFKVLVLGAGMFFAVKWHYEKGKKGGNVRAAPRTIVKIAVVFVLLLLSVLLLTYALSDKLGLDLALP